MEKNGGSGEKLFPKSSRGIDVFRQANGLQYSPARKSEEYVLPINRLRLPFGLFRSPFALSHRTRDRTPSHSEAVESNTKVGSGLDYFLVLLDF